MEYVETFFEEKKIKAKPPLARTFNDLGKRAARTLLLTKTIDKRTTFFTLLSINETHFTTELSINEPRISASLSINEPHFSVCYPLAKAKHTLVLGKKGAGRRRSHIATKKGTYTYRLMGHKFGVVSLDVRATKIGRLTINETDLIDSRATEKRVGIDVRATKTRLTGHKNLSKSGSLLTNQAANSKTSCFNKNNKTKLLLFKDIL